MDGRWIRKCWLAWCLVPGVVGCRTAEKTPWDAPGGDAGGMPTVSAKKPLWGSGPSLPVDVAVDSPKKGPPSPGTMVAIADLQLQRAMDDKAPVGNRPELLDTARQGYQKALLQDPKSKPALLGLARFYTRIGEREKAVEGYKKYLTLYPTEKDVAREVAVAHAQWKDWAGAISWCEFALKLDPENLTARKTMAFCYARAGQTEQAFEIMRRVVPEAQARYLLARVLEHQGDFAASRAQLEAALQIDQNYADAREFLTELDQVIAGKIPDQNGLRPDAGGVQQVGFTEPAAPQNPPPQQFQPSPQLPLPPQFAPRP
ncbi:glycosyl transferase family protein : Tetratricopeptide TPR_2 repeat protein OS=Pirellula staleyi (strain ATCC 27377 / DSM 6068 / ICPB 4128) GN=Psta_2170 PE=4 SV=1: TPR_7: TPR_19 [Gemmataceae bacterium]|nr:glycosyl transferase family protein : Tetratricopeptide TPR_2 repeat protein OS=Pirellula staleyi (strain ATCC 27377 / DSM 6068 / ICPB 4128) GN=Psta_2170 PE=4 SV=1: TPR_7: TPR_19 [Gemmataceae bacterium]VTT99942.1 glycosyl transferase family protein : Tetratricopeptide TPR_2 repeat protein OS=Pirellula staleyi (strain ATCC 27377 / DSM 6068 / ICPB 4128) GN=Psta_2170 PE=4 SV=1: TPR_7: TPR_19 [Gemmataceae bacterium]